MTTVSTSGAAGPGAPVRAGVHASALPGVWGEFVRPRSLALLGLSAVAFVVLFNDWLIRQFGVGGFSWTHTEDWGHAYAVPLISGYAVWKGRDRLARAPVEACWAGLSLLLLGIVMYVYFIAGYSNHMFQAAGLILTLAGAVLLVLGPRVFRILSFPIAFLGFAATISEMVMIKVTWGLKLLASQGSEVLLRVVGPLFSIEVERFGNVIHVLHNGDRHPLDVADACSGMRMVIAFVALSVAVAFLSCNQWWQRVAVVWLAVPVALLMNVVRVSVLAVLTIADPELAVGGAHAFIGTLLLIPAFGLFMAGVWAVKRITPDEPTTKGGAA